MSRKLYYYTTKVKNILKNTMEKFIIFFRDMHCIFSTNMHDHIKSFVLLVTEKVKMYGVVVVTLVVHAKGTEFYVAINEL